MAVREEVDSTGMRPKVGMTAMSLPITFDYSGGRRSKNKTKKVWAAILFVLSIILFFGLLFHKGTGIFKNVLLAVSVTYGILFFVRFILLGEGSYRKEKIKLIDTDNLLSDSDIWGIYDYSDMYPYIARFRSGRSGVFVLLHKDVILGKYDESEYEHYEAIGDAYNICGSSKIQICHIDYMDLIGSDDRIDESFRGLDRVYNPDLKDLLTDIYTYQQEVMSKQATTFDAYLFSWTGNDDTAWATIQRILSCFLDANYRGYKILNKSDIRDLTMVIENLEDFSVENGMLNAFGVRAENSSRCIVPIKVIHSDGSEEKLNKTSAEKQEEARQREEEIERRKGEIREKRKKQQEQKKSTFKDSGKGKGKGNSKGSKETKESEEEIDLF